MKIVVLDGYGLNPGDLSWDEMGQLGELVVYDRTTPEEVIGRAADADVILTNKVALKSKEMDALPKLKYIGVLATGYNIIDTDYAKSKGIIVTNIPAYSTDSVAQMTFAHILNITNRIEHYADQTRRGQWSRSKDFCYWDTPLVELAGKTIGIVGLGAIGLKVARVALEFGMDVFAFTSKNAADLPEGIRKTTLEGLLAISDVLTLHCPLNNETRKMINAESLSKMKKGAILINTGRGPLVDEQAVADALESGQLGAYGTDVMSAEPPAIDNPILKAPNAYVTPHVAWATFEARTRLMGIAVNNVKTFIEGNPVHIVNK
ncbi:MAG: D-2-hydroxyacid dehydrogenase [Prevotella sp.]|nr:D-2-hydroxyacid dehydrogenase [Prevotella sp.]MDY2634624.1 D-2-hydroxyacid dehydrogenase [Prevotella sp.]